MVICYSNNRKTNTENLAITILIRLLANITSNGTKRNHTTWRNEMRRISFVKFLRYITWVNMRKHQITQIQAILQNNWPIIPKVKKKLKNCSRLKETNENRPNKCDVWFWIGSFTIKDIIEPRDKTWMESENVMVVMLIFQFLWLNYVHLKIPLAISLN